MDMVLQEAGYRRLVESVAHHPLKSDLSPETIVQIENDVNRTFCEETGFSGNKEGIKRLLQALAAYKPIVGYV